MSDQDDSADFDAKAIVSSVFYKTKRAEKAFEYLDMLAQYGRERNYHKAVIILGFPRSGKTFLPENWAKLRYGVNGTHNLMARLPYVEAVPNSTLNKLAGTSLEAMGDPDPSYGNEAQKTQRVIDELKRREPIFTIFDEIHNLINSDTDTVVESGGKWLTRVLNGKVSPLLLIGEPKTMRLIGQNNRQLAGRIIGAYEVKPYDWADKADRHEFRALLYAIDEGLGLPERAQFSDANMALRIYAFCEGLIGLAANLIAAALAFARIRKLPRITMELMAEAADGQLLGERRRANPFRGPAPRSVRPAGND
ncbi:TniB family NTP-binding protein [Roseomonas aerophila]|uniref:TniB family NTP-binding protein n=1 Tax=Teichococcus aerophilus TaxID=1224513 RepID=A0ABR7RKP8_9PROT|nr:TniB family NTP-binding protein [Pseudoroseomonas aerophila]MBC9207089.1 TniB family NTP-binding protein [Pseudoroseomonas aerophila]